MSPLWDSKLSQRYWLGLKYYSLWHCVAWNKRKNVSEKLFFSAFMNRKFQNIQWKQNNVSIKCVHIYISHMPMLCVFGSVCLFYITFQNLNPQQIYEYNFTYIGICIIITTVLLLSLLILWRNYSVQCTTIFLNQVVPRSFAEHKILFVSSTV
jgi:hypothetical protein